MDCLKLFIYTALVFLSSTQLSLDNIFIQPAHTSRMWHKVSFQVEFKFNFPSPRLVAIYRLKDYYLPIAEEIIIGFITFPRVLPQYEKQKSSSRIWTLVTVSIYNDTFTLHHDIISISYIYIYIYIYICILYNFWQNFLFCYFLF